VKWSYSDSRTFGQCQRQWGFRRRIASATSPDTFRREAFLLSKLQSLAQWRGGLIDHVISVAVVPVLRQGRLPDRERVLQTAKASYETQLACALAHRLREPGLKISDLNGSFAAFYDVEYGSPPAPERLHHCWTEVENALTSLLELHDLLDDLRTSVALLDQRTLSVPFGGMSITARPDLIVFRRGAPPKVIDWKAHAHMQTAARSQLALYAIALTSANPHQDFPYDPRTVSAVDVVLSEVQLLRKEVHHYQLDARDIELAWSEIGQSMVEMQRSLGGEGADFDIAEIPPARRAETCDRCNFRRPCWQTVSDTEDRVTRTAAPVLIGVDSVTRKRAHGNTRQQHLPF
jgi:PD-(D/E)XK nuclease superfamily